MSEDESAPLFVFSYALTRADLIAGVRRVPNRTPRHHGLLAALVLAPPFIWGLIAPTAFPGLSSLAVYALALPALGLGALLTLPILNREDRQRIAALPERLPEATLRVFDDYMIESSDGAENHHDLDTLRPAISTPSHLFLEVAAGTVLTIPARAFADAAERAAFEAFLRPGGADSDRD